MRNDSDKAIYIVLVKAHTLLGRVARFFSNYEYTHIAVSMDRSLTEFTGFSRRKHYDPFDCGFTRERRDCFCYGTHRSVKLKVFRIPVTPDRYEAVQQLASCVEADPEYLFDLYGMKLRNVPYRFRIPKAYNCMSFTDDVLRLCGCLPRDGRIYSIPEVDEILTPYFYREGFMKRHGRETEGYMERVPIWTVAKHFVKLLHHLNMRFIRKQMQRPA